MSRKTRVTIIVDFESTQSMTDNEAMDRAIEHIKGEISPFDMSSLYGIRKISDEMKVSRERTS